MEKNHMKSDTLIELEFLTNNKINTHFHGDIEMLYVINGTLDVDVWDETYHLKPQDMIVINANHHHSYTGTGNLLVGRFLISLNKVREMLNQNVVLFWCNSAVETHDAFRELKMIINRIFNDSLKAESGMIYRNSLYYQLLHILSSNFLVPPGDIRYEKESLQEDDRLQEIFAYIRTNYHQNIRLQDLADHLFLSETYVSKYIKKKCDITFVELVNAVRLEYAMEDLMHSNSAIIKIAMDNGFASVAAFNKCFKAAHQLSPTEFRKKLHMQRKLKGDTPEEIQKRENIQRQLEAYLDENPLDEENGEFLPTTLTGDAKTKILTFQKQNCLGMINVGKLVDLLNSDIQSQILMSKDRLGFQYVRFWNCYGLETHLDIHVPVEQQNFSRIDSALDFLIRNELKPYFELGLKPIKLLKNTSEAVYEDVSDLQKFKNDTEMQRFYQNYISHLVRRYGANEVSTWYFELHEQEEIRFDKLSFTYEPISEEEHEKYMNSFDLIADIFRSVLPEVRLGGAGFPVQHYGRKGLEEIFKMWMNHAELPSFISITSFPYILEKEGNIYFEKRSTDMEFTRHNIDMTKEVLKCVEFPTQQVHVSEYGLTLSNRNVMNDSCYNGAFLVQNMISCVAERNVMMGHWLFSDLYADFYDTHAILFGGCGIVNKNGIPKPGWYAFDFMNACYPKVIARNKNCIITTNSSNEFRIVLHNMKNLNYDYYVKAENEISANDIPVMLEDRESLTMRLKIKNTVNGNYLIRNRKINQLYGSIQEEWKQLNMLKDLTRWEIDHLKKITTSNMTIRQMEVKNHTLEIEVSLKANEISYLSISLV